MSQKWALEGICLGAGSSLVSSLQTGPPPGAQLPGELVKLEDIGNFCCRLTLIKDNIHLKFHPGANIEEIITENWTTTQFREKINFLKLFDSYVEMERSTLKFRSLKICFIFFSFVYLKQSRESLGLSCKT